MASLRRRAASSRPRPSAVLHGVVQQLPAGDQVLQHPFEALAVGVRGARLALDERQQNAVVVGIDKAVVDFLLFGLAILVLVLGSLDDRRLAIVLGLLQAETDRLLDRAERDGGSLVGKALHRFDAVLFEDPLHAADGVALAV